MLFILIMHIRLGLCDVTTPKNCGLKYLNSDNFLSYLPVDFDQTCIKIFGLESSILIDILSFYNFFPFKLWLPLSLLFNLI